MAGGRSTDRDAGVVLSGLAICHEMQPVHSGAVIDEVRARIASGRTDPLPLRRMLLWV